MSSSDPRSITSSFHRVTLGGQDNEFGIPQSPPGSTANPWTLHVNRHRENSPTRLQKAKTSDLPKNDSEALSTLDVPNPSSANMRRRASCPDFAVPDFKLPEIESAKLMNRRPSLISQTVIESFNQVSRRHVIKAPTGLPITELPETPDADSGNSPCPVALTEKPSLLTDKTAVVPSQQQGLLLSKVSSMFTAQQTSQKSTNFTAVGVTANLDTGDGAGGATSVISPKKKSYFARRAAAITNADMNAMAPTSL